MKHIITAAALAVTLAGCATTNDQIQGSHVSAATYASYSCDQMQAEAQTLSAKARALGVEQDAKAGSDAAMTAVSLLLFWPAVFFISGDGANAQELAHIKGRAEALQTAAQQRGCDIGG